MEPDQLALELAPWIDLQTISEVALGRQSGEEIEQPAELVLAAPELSSGRDGGLADLIEEYVTHFRVPEAWLASLRGLVVDGAIHESTWAWLAGLRWEGTIETDVDVEGYWVPRAQVLLKGPQAVLAVLRHAAIMLMHSIVLVYPKWKTLHETLGADGVYVRPALDGPLAVHIDNCVARSLGIEGAIRAGRSESRIVVGYRYVAMSGGATELRSGDLAGAAREAARL